MKTPEQRVLEDKYAMLQLEYSELKDKYDQLCGKLKRNANDSRNEGDAFLSTYNSSGRRVPWE